MLINRREAPAYRLVESVDLIRPEEFVLDNGVKGYSISAGAQELVRIEFIFPNLNWSKQAPLNATVVNSLLTEGTRSMTAAEISGFVDYHGAFMQVDYSYDHSSLILFTLNKHVNTLLPVIVESVFSAVFPQEELDTHKRNSRQKLLVSLQKNDAVARRELNNLMFGDSRYGYRVVPDDYDKVSRDSLLHYFSDTYTTENLTLIVSGKVTGEVISAINAHVGAVASGVRSSAESPIAFPGHMPRQHVFEKPDALQSAIRMGKRAVHRSHPDFPALQVLTTIFGGYFGSRLMTNIREDKGYTYGIGAGLASLKQGGYFYIASEVGAGVCAATLAEIKREMDILRSQAVPEEELSLVRNYMMGSLLGDLENAFSHADKFKTILFNGLDYGYYDRYVETVRTISSESLMELAGQYLDFGTFEQVIVGRNPEE